MNPRSSTQKPIAGLKPKDTLRLMETHAAEVRKRLRALEAHKWFSKTGGSTDDAVALAERIESQSMHGQRCTAAEAIEIVDEVEAWCLELEGRIDALLASRNQQVG